MSLTVAVITDIHHGLDSEYVKGSMALPFFEEALVELERRRPSLLVDLGDRINQKALAGARVAMSEVAAGFCPLPLPRIHLQGNHDLIPRSEQETLLGVPLGNRCLELGGWQLIFLDTWDGSVGGALSPQTLAWLERTLASSELPAVVFSHQPLDGQPLPGNVFFGGPYRRQAHPQGHEAARRIMARSGKVKLAVGGHAHWNHSVTVAGIRYLTLAALVPYAEGEDEGGSYGLLTLDSDTLQLEVYRCGSRACQFQAVVEREAPPA
jgi:3',5'-cyclic-AMP phosphodiesterase